MIILRPKNYYLGFWYVAPPQVKTSSLSSVDWFGGAWREEDGYYVVSYCFHYGNLPPDRWREYRLRPYKDKEKRLLGVMDEVASLMALRNNTFISSLQINGGGREALRLLREQPWFRTGMVKGDELET